MGSHPTLEIVETRYGEIHVWPEKLQANLDAVNMNALLNSSEPPFSPIKVNRSWMLTNGQELHDQRGLIHPESDIGRYLYAKLLVAAEVAAR